MIEYSITIKDEKNTYILKDFELEKLLMSKDNLLLKGKIEGALLDFGFDPKQESPQIFVKAKLNWQN
jgi:hypothetical protein